MLEALLSKEILFSNKWSLSVDLRVNFHAVNRLYIVRIAAGIDYRFWIQILPMSYTVHLPMADHIASPHPRQSPNIITIIKISPCAHSDWSKTMFYLRNRTHVPWENEKCCGNTSRREPFGKTELIFPFTFHPKFPGIFL